jgi:hypothetical protein
VKFSVSDNLSTRLDACCRQDGAERDERFVG